MVAPKIQADKIGQGIVYADSPDAHTCSQSQKYAHAILREETPLDFHCPAALDPPILSTIPAPTITLSHRGLNR